MKNKILINKARVKILIIISLISLISSVLVSLYFINHYKKYTENNTNNSIKNLRDNKIREIKDEYNALFSEIELFSSLLGEKLLLTEKLDFPIGVQNHFNKNKFIENIYIIDKNYEIKSKYKNMQSKNTESLNIIQELKKIKFEEALYCTNFYVKDNNAYQYIFYKLSTGWYCAFHINNNIFEKNFKVDDEAESVIYNNEFQVIYSNNTKKIFTSEINTLTKKILEGNTSIETYNGFVNSYGFIDLMSSTMYINQQRETSIYDIGLIKIYTVLIIIFAFMISGIIGILITKNINLNNIATKDSILVANFGEHIAEALVDIEKVTDSLEKLKFLRDDLEKSYSIINNENNNG